MLLDQQFSNNWGCSPPHPRGGMVALRSTSGSHPDVLLAWVDLQRPLWPSEIALAETSESLLVVSVWSHVWRNVCRGLWRLSQAWGSCHR